jgi:hypothetical protein
MVMVPRRRWTRGDSLAELSALYAEKSAPTGAEPEAIRLIGTGRIPIPIRGETAYGAADDSLSIDSNLR